MQTPTFQLVRDISATALLALLALPVPAGAVCVCLNNATVLDLDTGSGGDDGQFSDRILVNAPAGQTWRVTAQTGAFDAFNVPPVGMRSPLVPIATDGSVLLMPGPGANQYFLDFVFVEAAGWSFTVSNGTTSLAIAGNCSYPNPTFSPAIESVYASTDPPVTLGAQPVSGPPLANAVFAIDAVQQTQLIPSALALRPTVHTVELSATGTVEGQFRACVQGVRKSFVIASQSSAPTIGVVGGALLLAALLGFGVRALRRA